MKNKQGISTVITTLLIIAIVLIAITIVWVVIGGIIEEGKKQISLGKLTLDIDIKYAWLFNDTNNISIKVKRDPGFGNLEAIKFLFYSETASEGFRRETNLDELEERVFMFHLDVLYVDDLIKVSVVPILTTEEGDEFLGELIDTYTIIPLSSSSSSSGGPPCTPGTCVSLGYNCGSPDDGCGTALSCGNCSGGEFCNASYQCEIIPNCSLTNAYWSSGEVEEGTEVTLTVNGTNCGTENVNFTIWEYDSGTDDGVVTNPSNSQFSGGSVETTWDAEYQNDSDGDGDPPEYYFIAKLVSNTSISIQSSAPRLNVTEDICIPETCGSLGLECDSGWDDLCGGTLDCGNCSGGEFCNATGQCVADTTPPTFDNLANQTISETQSLLYDINASDSGSGVDCFSVNDTTNFEINCLGVLTNKTILSINEYWINISVNDTAGNENFGVIYINVTESTNTAPTHSEPLIFPYPTYNTDNLVCVNQSTFDAEGDSVTNIYNWLVDDTSIAVLNLPFDAEVNGVQAIVKDYSTYGNNGTLGNATVGTQPTWTSNGQVGGAYEFDGNGEDFGIYNYIEIADDSSLNPSNFTYSAWVNLSVNDLSNEYMIINNGVNRQFVVRDGKLSFQYAPGGLRMTGITTLQVDQWYYVVFTYNGTTAILHLNGAEELSNVRTISSGSGVVRIGRAHDDYGAGFNGTIDEVKIYNRGLSAEQIYQIYLDTKEGYSNSSTIVSQETISGENWACEVTPNDAIEDGITKQNSSVIQDGASCLLINANWSDVLVEEGTQVTLTVNGTNCNLEEVNFTIWEDDIFGDDPVIINPEDVFFSGDTATTTWIAEYQDDVSGNPEYYFIATLVSNASENIQSSDPMLEVSESQQSSITIFSPIEAMTYDTDYVDLNWSVNEEVLWCAYSLDGGANDTSILSSYLTQISSFSNSSLNGARSVFVEGDYAYVASYNNDSLTIINVSDEANPVQVSSLSNNSMDGANSVFVEGDYAYVASYNNDSLTIIDVSDKYNPVQVSSLSDSSSMNSAISIDVKGDYAYIAALLGDSLTIIDVSNKYNPVQVSSLSNNSMDGAFSVFVGGDYAYVASYNNDSLTIINVSDKYYPIQVSSLSDSSSMDMARSVFVEGDYAYVASYNNDSLTIINVSDKYNPVQVSSLSNNSMDGATSVFVEGDYAYVASYNNDSLTIINVSDKYYPIQVSSLSDSSSMDMARSVFVEGDYAYVASSVTGSLTILKVVGEKNLTLTSLSEGSHNVVISCNDSLGQISQSNVVNFDIDTVTMRLTCGDIAHPNCVEIDTCRILDQEDTYYLLMNNVQSSASCFVIHNENITLDLNDYTITFGVVPGPFIANPGFEDGTTGWDFSNAPNAELHQGTYIPPQVAWGDYSIRWQLPANDGEYIESTQLVHLYPGITYKFYAMVYAYPDWSPYSGLGWSIQGDVKFFAEIVETGYRIERNAVSVEGFYAMVGDAFTVDQEMDVTIRFGVTGNDLDLAYNTGRYIYIDELVLKPTYRHGVLIPYGNNTAYNWHYPDDAPTPPGFSNMYFKVKNGKIIQANSSDYFSKGVYYILGNYGEVSDLNITVHGLMSENIKIWESENYMDIHHNTLCNNARFTRTRHTYPIDVISGRNQAAGGHNKIHDNQILCSMQRGIYMPSEHNEIYNNYINITSFYTNNFAIMDPGYNSTIYNNTIINNYGRGIHISSYNISIYNNKIDVKWGANQEYPFGAWGGYGIQLEYPGAHDNLIFNNTVIARADAGTDRCKALVIAGDTGGNNKVYDNNFTAITSDIDKPATVISIGSLENSNNQIFNNYLYGNSRIYFFAYTKNLTIWENYVYRLPNITNFYFLEQYSRTDLPDEYSEDVSILNHTYGPGANMSYYKLNVNGAEYFESWYLNLSVKKPDNSPAANANYLVLDKYGDPEKWGQTNSNGNVLIPIRKFALTSPLDSWDSAIVNYTPHTIKAGLDADGASQIITMDSFKSLILTLVAGAAEDIEPPIISDVAANPDISSSEITWTTDEPSTSQVEHGPTNTYGLETIFDPSYVISHSQQITQLYSNTLYHYITKSKDQLYGIPEASGDYTFTTNPIPEATIYNHGFENCSIDGEDPPNWTINSQTDTGCWADNPFRGAWRFYAMQNNYAYQELNLTAGQTYKFRTYAMVYQSPQTVTLLVSTAPGGGTTRCTDSTGSRSWVEITCSYTPSSDETVYLNLIAGPDAISARFDEVAIGMFS